MREDNLSLTSPDLQVLNTVLILLSLLSHKGRVHSGLTVMQYSGTVVFLLVILFWLIATLLDNSSKTLYVPPEER